ncbi:unnamed protein product, partial [Trypanosoma congolense IL3000]
MGEGGVKRERDAATDAVARPVTGRKATRTGGTWTLDSLVEDVLLERCGGLSDMSLHDFLMKHFKKTFGVEDTSMRVFMGDPTLCVSDEAVLRRITNSAPYREYELYEAMKKEADRLNDVGIFSLRQWARAADKAGNFNAYVKGMLDAALGVARGNAEAMKIVYASDAEVLDDVYDSVLSATWSCVVRSDEYDEKWLGMGVVGMAPGEQPQLWSKEQAGVKCYHCNPWDGDEVPGVNGKLVMAVLSSQRGWPHMLFDAEKAQLEEVDTLTCYNAACDAYIRRENLRVWHIVKERLDMWLKNGADVSLFAVIGTPGIGKSSGTGSLLLYQLLHYPLEKLKVVAYFVKGEAYIFHRAHKKVVHYKEEGFAIHDIKELISKCIKGYIIYDISEMCNDIGSLPDKWGVVFISSPNKDNFKKFTEKVSYVSHIPMNCFEDYEFKAALVWERHWQLAKGQIKLENVNLGKDWEVLRKRIHMVGPLPRYVLGSEECYCRRVADVDAALSRNPVYHIEHYTRLLCNSGVRPHPYTESEMVKLVPAYIGEPRSQAVCTYVRGRLLRDAMRNFKCMGLGECDLISRRELNTLAFEMAGLRAFTIWGVVTEVVRRLKYLPREGETASSRSSVLCRAGAQGRVPASIHYFSSADIPVEMVAECLYKPTEENFHIAEGFFLVDAVGEGASFPEGAGPPTQTIVLLQVTEENGHYITTGKVGMFRERAAAFFTNWEEMENRLTYEMIYLQHAEGPAITARQCCDCHHHVTDDVDNVRFWNRIDQFQVKLEA